MQYGLYVSAEGAQAQAKRLEALSNNLANVETPGFKRQLAVFQSRLSEATGQGLDMTGSESINDLSGGIFVTSTHTDFSAGPMKQTGVPTDVAIPGQGFFVVEKDGENYLTRSGDFRVTTEGALVTQQGHSVMDSGGSPIAIDLAAGPFEFTNDGNILQGIGAARSLTGQALAIVMPADVNQLAKVGENLFRAEGEEPTPVADRRVAPEFLEQSGVKPTLEMMQLIETSRAFEANVNMIRQQDQMVGGLLGRVLRS